MSRILLVEDDRDVADWIVHCLHGDGHEVRSVSDGASARALTARADGYRPDVVVMDYALPDTDGVVLLGELEEAWPGLGAVFVTVQWTGEVIARIERTGRARLAKPFDPDELRAAVRRALDAGGRPR
jgi:DNA-binding response OmpR family regulator